MSALEKIEITDLRPPIKNYVYAGGQLMHWSEARRSYSSRDIHDPLDTSMGNLLENRDSLLFPDGICNPYTARQQKLSKYIMDNRVFIGHIAEDGLTSGMVAIGRCYLANGRQDGQQITVLETLTGPIKRDVVSAIITKSLDVFEVDEECLHVFTPKAVSSGRRIGQMIGRSRATVIGESLEVVMPDKTRNSAVGVLEEYAAFSRRIS